MDKPNIILNCKTINRQKNKRVKKRTKTNIEQTFLT